MDNPFGSNYRPGALSSNPRARYIGDPDLARLANDAQEDHATLGDEMRDLEKWAAYNERQCQRDLNKELYGFKDF